MHVENKPSVKIGVITPYHREPLSMLQRAHDSVLAQEATCTHILVADGFAKPEIDAWNCHHIKLPQAHADGGAFGRGIGGLHAVSAGFDYISFLDADCWFDTNHASSLVEIAQRTGSLVVTSARKLIRLDGTILSNFDNHSNGDDFADTSTMMLHRDAKDLLALSAQLPPETGPICDHIIWIIAKMRGYKCSHTGLNTMNFTTRYGVHYSEAGETIPKGAIGLDDITKARYYWNELRDNQIGLLVRGSPKK